MTAVRTGLEATGQIGQSGQLLGEARLREHPDWADRLIAGKLGCSYTTVAVVRQELEATAQIGQLDEHLGEDGRWYKSKRKTVAESPAPALLIDDE